MIKHLDLFSGIGGFALAARWTGAIETVCFVEIDPFCQRVLNKNFPGVPIISDIREVTGERIREIVADTGCVGQEKCKEQTTGVEQCSEIIADTEHDGLHGTYAERTTPEPQEQDGQNGIGQSEGRTPVSHGIDILTGGFPCQPFSAAGKRKGKNDDRFLWPEMLRVIAECKPTWIIGENVAGLINMAQPDSQPEMGCETDTDIEENADCDARGILGGIIDDLENLGYEVQPFVIPACSVGAPHRRDRVWIVAYSTSKGLSESRLTGIRELQEKSGAGVHDRLEQQDRYAPDTEHTTPSRHGQDGRGILPVAESIRLDNDNFWSEDWCTVALRTCVRNLDDGLPGRMAGRHRVNKLKALGNSVVPAIPYQIMMAILEVENA